MAARGQAEFPRFLPFDLSVTTTKGVKEEVVTQHLGFPVIHLHYIVKPRPLARLCTRSLYPNLRLETSERSFSR